MFRWRPHDIATGSTRTSRASASQDNVTDILTGVAKTVAVATAFGVLAITARAISHWWEDEESNDSKGNGTMSGTPQSAITSGAVPGSTASGLSDGPTALLDSVKSQEVAEHIAKPDSTVQKPSAREAGGLSDSPMTRSFGTSIENEDAEISKPPSQRTAKYAETSTPAQVGPVLEGALKPFDPSCIRKVTRTDQIESAVSTFSPVSIDKHSARPAATVRFACSTQGTIRNNKRDSSDGDLLDYDSSASIASTSDGEDNPEAKSTYPSVARRAEASSPHSSHPTCTPSPPYSFLTSRRPPDPLPDLARKFAPEIQRAATATSGFNAPTACIEHPSANLSLSSEGGRRDEASHSYNDGGALGTVSPFHENSYNEPYGQDCDTRIDSAPQQKNPHSAISKHGKRSTRESQTRRHDSRYSNTTSRGRISFFGKPWSLFGNKTDKNQRKR